MAGKVASPIVRVRMLLVIVVLVLVVSVKEGSMGSFGLELL